MPVESNPSFTSLPTSVPVTPLQLEAPIRHYREDIRRALLIAPVVLIAAMSAVFRGFALFIGSQTATYLGFALYWVACGIGIPLLIVGRRGFVDILLSRETPRHRLPWAAAVLLAGPAIVGFVFVFPAFFPDAAERMLLALVVYALVNGVLEEVFWRGLFSRVFPTEVGRGLLYPAVMYAAWLIVPLSLYPPWTLIDALSAFAVGLGIGLLYGWVAWRTGSIRWTMLSHVLMNLGGVGALLIFRY